MRKGQRKRQPTPEPQPGARFVPARSSARILGQPDDRFVILEQEHGQWVRGRVVRRTWKVH